VLVNIIKSLRKYVSIRLYNCLEKSNDETLPNFIKRKHPRKGEKKKQGARTKVQASKHPKRGRPQGGKGTTKNRTLQNQIVCEI
jgi:hypothetical protein